MHGGTSPAPADTHLQLREPNLVTNAQDRSPIKRALISVYDKTGLEELATGLNRAGVAIVSTGSTAQKIAAAGVPVTEVADLTGFPECLEGRVKTLHPRVHAGILADRRKQDHVQQLQDLGVEPFDLVVVNLYPFVDTVNSGAEPDAVVEQIDIGGPSMVRAAAKNHPSVAVVVEPDRYPEVVDAASNGGFDLAARRRLAAAAFAHTAAYDTAVATWCQQQFPEDSQQATTPLTFPPYAGLAFERAESLRYGENPHQEAALYVDHAAAPGIAQAEQLQGKAMSYNNYVDADAALRAVHDFTQPAVAVVKHNNPCGLAVADPGAAAAVANAHAKAHACDPLSAYGGVIAVNSTVTAATAESIKPIFTEVVVAPAFEPEALEIFSTKKNLRVLQLPASFGQDPLEYRQISGGALMQVSDRVQAPGDDPANWQLVAGEAADEATLADLAFAWTALRPVKSNAILLAKDGATVGIGMGQVNRVDSCRLAIERANTLAESGAARAEGSVAASDAFFPFADGLKVLLDAGVKAVVQPGGSIRDEEVIAAAQEAGVTMYFTGARHFFH
ncbi:bifunctional phosphoribosylaminoimidazolecarboxamide formyltransferase/IMP cyclohydrolase [Kocuria subflava]|uniref:Bifunctional purine biosynthesis protein PurH n=2 Tax=Kocuria TaxID=57493 RepID=A0A846TQE8_9MICC|nr:MULTISPECIES: bifunctional phosphoribosylaminoimidazolecarboxamide formyltransferase/IMP cyclohydrolase [Kocuria]NKE09049.1 bifunctional phosphoribosylaminoimidazolecarboxamide formyltransferase/IMP cyclohydrolase [Kocuria subflava]